MAELLSRRDALRSVAALLAPAGLTTAADVPVAPPPRKKFDLPVIDTHFHTVDPQLPGMPAALAPDEETPLSPFDQNPREGRRKLAKAIESRLAEAGVVAALCMPSSEVSDRDPLGVREVEVLAPLVSGAKLYAVGFANPERFDLAHMAKVESALRGGRVKALKAYLGYLHYGPEHIGYRPYYKLAAKYKVPVILHTGDPYSKKAKLRFAHPLPIDDVATDYPDTRFVLAHFGNPWLPDAAELVLKNDNVWADLSAFLVGNAEQFAAYDAAGATGRVAARVADWVEFTGKPDRFLFGSDWPLAPVKVYRDFVRKMVPEEFHAAVFHDNARSLFGV